MNVVTIAKGNTASMATPKIWIPKMKEKKAKSHMYIPMGPQKKGYSNTKAAKVVRLLRSISNLGRNLKGTAVAG